MIRCMVLLCALLVQLALAQAQETGADWPRFAGYHKAPTFSVVSRKEKLTFYPCTQCHKFMEPNARPRKLSAPHNISLKHGDGRIWCISCHHLTERDSLASILGDKVDFNDAYLVCGGCHANRQKDWYFGGHGKRVGNWDGERELYSCVHCHDPHDPSIKPRKPQPPPPVRVGLERPAGEPHERRPLWERTTGQGALEDNHE